MTLDNIAFDPGAMQNAMLNALAKKDVVILDPTTPAGNMVEVFTSTTTDALQEMAKGIRLHAPILASTYDEVFRHIDSETLLGVYAVPAKTLLRIYVDKHSILTEGLKSESRTKLTIPKFTSIKVADLDFTILEDVDVSIFGTREHVEAGFDIFGKSKGIIPSKQVTDSNGVRWVIFDLVVEQVNRIESFTTVTADYLLKVPIEDQFSYCKVFLAEDDKPEVEIATTFSDIVYDNTKPTLHVRVEDDQVVYSTPSVFVGEKILSGKIRIETYTSKGKVVASLNKVDITEFTITRGNTRSIPSAMGIGNAHLMVNSPFVLDGGNNKPTLEALKEKIIHDTLGHVDSAVTFKALEEKASRFNFKLTTHEDSITNRVFRASKSLPNDNNNLTTRIDMFSNTVHIVNSKLANTRVKNIHDTTVIASNTIFKTQGGTTTPITIEEETHLFSLVESDLKETLKNLRYFSTPFYYMLNSSTTVSENRAYDLDLPVVNDLAILAKNTYTEMSINVSEARISKASTGYSLSLRVIFNEVLKAIPRHNVACEVFIGGKAISITSVLDPITDAFTLTLNSTHYVSEKDEIEVTNVTSNLSSNLVPLKGKMDIYFYIKDESAGVDAFTYTSDVSYNGKHQVLTKQTLNYELGDRLDFIWNKVDISFTPKKYKVREFDKLATYKEDVYERFDNDSIYKVVTVNGKKELVSNKLHSKGDTKLDGDGNPIFIYRKGEVLTNELNQPIIDIDNGLLRFVDILMLEIHYYLINEDRYNDSLLFAKNTLRRWLKLDLKLLNDNTLEQTEILYKPSKTMGEVSLMLNGTVMTLKETLIPVVTLYTEGDKISTTFTTSEITSKLGYTLTSFLEGEIKDIVALKETIKKDLDYLIEAVSIGFKDTAGKIVEAEILQTKNDGTFTLSKTIDRREVVYQIETSIVNVK